MSQTTWIVETSDAINDGNGWSVNACWCDRQEIVLDGALTDRQTITALRKVAGLNGSNAKTEYCSDGYKWKHPGAAILTFAMPRY
jgi:hypothetical protein